MMRNNPFDNDDIDSVVPIHRLFGYGEPDLENEGDFTDQEVAVI